MGKRKTTSGEGWTRVRFGDVVRLSTERCPDPLAQGIERYVGLEHLEPGDLRIRSWGNVADGVTFTNRFRPGQVLYGKRRAYQRKVAVAEFDGICSSDIYVFEPADDRLIPGLLPFVCQSDGFFEHALKTSAGSLSPRTNWSSLADYEFDLPPLREQTRRLAVYTASTTATETLLQCKAAANRVVLATIEQMVAPWILSAAPLSEVATVWDCKHQTPKIVDSGVPMTSPGVTRWGPLDLGRCKQVDVQQAAAFMDHVSPRPFDLVMGRNQVVGVASYIAPDTTPFVLGQDTVLIRGTTVCGQYLALALRSRYVQSQIASCSLGTTFNRINLKDIRSLMIPHPPEKVAAALGESYMAIEGLDRRIETRRGIQAALNRDLLAM